MLKFKDDEERNFWESVFLYCIRGGKSELVSSQMADASLIYRRTRLAEAGV